MEGNNAKVIENAEGRCKHLQLEHGLTPFVFEMYRPENYAFNCGFY